MENCGLVHSWVHTWYDLFEELCCFGDTYPGNKIANDRLVTMYDMLKQTSPQNYGDKTELNNIKKKEDLN